MCSLYNNCFFFNFILSFNQHSIWFLLGIAGIYTQIGHILYLITKNSPVELIRIQSTTQPFDMN